MRQIIIKDRQTLTDIAVQCLGSAEGACDIARLNGLSVTSDVEPGSVIVLPEPVNRRIVDFFKRIKVFPAMKIDVSTRPGGIGYMQIGTDFIVS